jgi:hypothetical protein
MGEQGDRERVSDGGLIWLKEDICVWNVKVKHFSTISIHFFKKLRVKQVFSRVGTSGRGEVHKERVNESENSGCILYSYMNKEEWNLLKLF